MKKKLTPLLLVLVLCLPLLQNLTVSAASLPTEQQFADKIAALKMQYPHDYYWNQYNGSDSEGNSKAGKIPCSGVSNYDKKSCVSHGYCGYGGSCTCKCGKYRTGYQCFGYANLMAYKVFGSHAMNQNSSAGINSAGGWQYKTGVSEYYAGDVVRINNRHSIFLLKITASTVYYTDCNSTGPCKISWNKSMTLSKLKSSTTYVAHKSGNTLKGTGSAESEKPNDTLSVHFDLAGVSLSATYQVATTGSLNMRASASTSAAKVASIPTGTTLNVSCVLEGGGYVWGKTEYAGQAGWCVLSGGYAKTSASYITAEDGTLYNAQTLKPESREWKYNTDKAQALPSADVFKVKREGYQFLGWALQKDSTEVFGTQGETYKAEELCSTGAATVTIHALWLNASLQVDSVCVHSYPLSMVYDIGEPLDTDGMTLAVIYKDLSEMEIHSGFTVEGYDAETEGEQTLWVYYKNVVTSMTVTVGRTDAEGHFLKHKTVPVSCTEDGCELYYCEECRYEERENVITAPGHKPVGKATCTEDQICEVCHEILQAHTGHDYVAALVPAHDEVPTVLRYTCSHCHDTYDEPLSHKLIPGDTDFNGSLSAEDISALAKYLAHTESFAMPAGIFCADYNGDEAIDSADLTGLAKAVAQIEAGQ